MGIVNHLKIVKQLAGGGFNPDHLAEMLSQLGMEVDMREVELSEEVGGRFTESASLPGTKLAEIHGVTRDGEIFHILVALTSAPPKRAPLVTSDLKLNLRGVVTLDA